MITGVNLSSYFCVNPQRTNLEKVANTTGLIGSVFFTGCSFIFLGQPAIYYTFLGIGSALSIYHIIQIVRYEEPHHVVNSLSIPKTPLNMQNPRVTPANSNENCSIKKVAFNPVTSAIEPSPVLTPTPKVEPKIEPKVEPKKEPPTPPKAQIVVSQDDCMVDYVHVAQPESRLPMESIEPNLSPESNAAWKRVVFKMRLLFGWGTI